MRRIFTVTLLVCLSVSALLAVPLQRTIVIGGYSLSFMDNEYSSVLVRYDKKGTPEECGVLIKLFMKVGAMHCLTNQVKLVFPKYFNLPRPDYDLQILKVRYLIDQKIQAFLSSQETTLVIDTIDY
jgi:hypothetical protein